MNAPSTANLAMRAERVRKSFGAAAVLNGVDLEVQRGEVVCIIGPSGSGKSTFLRCINSLEKMDGGRIWLGDKLVGHHQVGTKLHELSHAEICKQRTGVGMVFQHFNLFPHKTVLENVVEAPVGVLREKPAVVRDRAMTLLSQVGLGEKSGAYPRALSGGQQQRVAIARALCMRPELMLFDEPTSALDPELVGDVLKVMRDLAESGMTMIVVTHEIGFARSVADRVAFFDSGYIVECGPAAEVIGNPRHERTAQFLAAVR
jgi:polar amino acid transport system ATP-binding protein